MRKEWKIIISWKSSSKGEKKVAFQLLLLSITFQKELNVTKGMWKEDVAGFLIAFYSFQKLKKGKKKKEQKETKGHLKEHPFFLMDDTS